MGYIAGQSIPLDLWVGEQVAFMNCTKSEKPFPAFLGFGWASANLLGFDRLFLQESFWASLFLESKV
ncbi:hypothetical protein ACFXTH_019565 [Malus domestica]